LRFYFLLSDDGEGSLHSRAAHEGDHKSSGVLIWYS